MALIGGAAIIGILAAAGVILASDPAPIESRHFTDKDRVNAAGIGTSFTSQSGQMASSTPVATIVQPDVEVFVPNSLEGKMRITNHEFLDEYADHDSPIYRVISREIENDIATSINDDSVVVKVLNIT